MAVTLGTFSRTAGLFIYIPWLNLIVTNAFCDNFDQGTILHTVSIGDKAVLNCNYSSEGNKKWLYNYNAILFVNKIKTSNAFGDNLAILQNYSLYIKNSTLENDGLYQCRNKSQIFSEYLLLVEVLPDVTLSITKEPDDETVIPKNRFIEVTCLAKGSKPAVNVSWLLDNDTVDSTNTQSNRASVNEDNNRTFDTVSILTFQPKSNPVNITCVVQGFGKATSYHLEYKPPNFEKLEQQNAVIIALGISFLTIMSCAFGFVIRKSHFTGRASIEITPVTFEKNLHVPDNNCSSNYQDLIRSEVASSAATDPFEGPFNGSNELSFEDYIASSEKLPGKGIIRYWKATMPNFTNTGNVTIVKKGLSENATAEDQALFRNMAIRLMATPKHRNIVETIKVTTKVPYFIYQEYIDNMNLKDYLSKSLKACDFYDNDASGTSKEIQTKLAKAVMDIVDAMTFLSKENLGHPALSSRKVLLDSFFRCKLYDFWPHSLCISKIQQIIQKSNPMVAWLAPETSSTLQYSGKSDVWSFATLLWEVYTLGDTPYKDMTSGDIALDIKRSMYLNQPYLCPRNVYDIMLVSWIMDPEERPSFASIRKMLNNIKEFMDLNLTANEPIPYFVLDGTQEKDNIYDETLSNV